MINTKLIHDFVAHWTGKGYEKGESQPFWLDLLHALGVEAPAQFIEYEQQVHLDHTAFIDGYIPSTKVMIEQKSSKKDLGESIRQSDGSLLNPFQQAKRYAAELPLQPTISHWRIPSMFLTHCVLRAVTRRLRHYKQHPQCLTVNALRMVIS